MLLRAEHVETDEKPVLVPEALKKCHLCGGTSFRSVGTGTGKPSETYAYVPGYFRRVVYTREVAACRCGGCVITAPAPERWSDKTRYDAGFAAHLVVSKCLMVTPRYRLEQMFARLGVPIARSTINDLFRRAGQKLEPLRAPLFEAIKAIGGAQGLNFLSEPRGKARRAACARRCSRRVPPGRAKSVCTSRRARHAGRRVRQRRLGTRSITSPR